MGVGGGRVCGVGGMEDKGRTVGVSVSDIFGFERGRVGRKDVV